MGSARQVYRVLKGGGSRGPNTPYDSLRLPRYLLPVTPFP